MVNLNQYFQELQEDIINSCNKNEFESKTGDWRAIEEIFFSVGTLILKYNRDITRKEMIDKIVIEYKNMIDRLIK